MHRFAALLLSLCLALTALPASAAATPLRASLVPQQPLVERTRDGQHLNFDLMFANDGDRALELTRLELTLFDRDGRFFAQRRLDTNGDSTTDVDPHRAQPHTAREGQAGGVQPVRPLSRRHLAGRPAL